jgi:hypothetical protein
MKLSQAAELGEAISKNCNNLLNLFLNNLNYFQTTLLFLSINLNKVIGFNRIFKFNDRLKFIIDITLNL